METYHPIWRKSPLTPELHFTLVVPVKYFPREFSLICDWEGLNTVIKRRVVQTFGPGVRPVIKLSKSGISVIRRSGDFLRRLTTVFLALGWIFSNQYLAWKACFDFHHTSPTFQPMIKFYVLVGFPSNSCYHSNGDAKHFDLDNVDYLEI